MKVMILGAGGYLGKVLYSLCCEDTDMIVYGTYFTKPIEGMVHLDLFDMDRVRVVMEEINPDAIVWCVKNEDKEMELSEMGLRRIVSVCKPTVRLIYVSTCLSSQENHDEDAPPEPKEDTQYMSQYVNGKILGEQLVRNHPNHVIIRPGQIFGFGADTEWDVRMKRIQSWVDENGSVVRTANAYISIIHVDDLAMCICELLHNRFTGTLCIAADKPVSYYEFYRYLAKQIHISEDKVIPEYAEKPVSNYYDTAKAKSLLKTEIRNVCYTEHRKH